MDEVHAREAYFQSAPRIQNPPMGASRTWLYGERKEKAPGKIRPRNGSRAE